MRVIARAYGREARLLRLPWAIVRGSARCADLWSRIRGRPSFFSVDKVRDLAAVGWVADAAPARKALGFEARIGLEAGWRGLAELSRADA